MRHLLNDLIEAQLTLITAGSPSMADCASLAAVAAPDGLVGQWAVTVEAALGRGLLLGARMLSSASPAVHAWSSFEWVRALLGSLVGRVLRLPS